MILLSDGRSNYGSDPRTVAETAADRGVQISTVGLGNSIDEDELQDIADITGGDYYHVADEEDLPETFERVAENQSEPQLKDTSDDGIPDAVSDANLFVPDRDGGGVVDVALRIDPTLRDTSGDGLPDHENVDIDYTVFQDDGDWKLEATVDEYHARPSKSDTDGDLLSDYEELKIWNTNPKIADTSDDGLIDSVDPAPHERTLPPEFEYQSYDINDLTILPTTIVTTRDDLAIVARPTGGADDIEEIRVHQYVDTWLPFIDDGWRNETYTGDPLDDGDGVYVTTAFGDSTGTVSPERVEITVVDDDGNTAGVSHDVDRGAVDVSAGVSAAGATTATLAVGAVAQPQYAGAATVTSAGVTTAGFAVGGVVIVGAGYALMAETTGSADGEFSKQEYIQPVPVTEPVGEWDSGELEITLPSGAAIEHEIHDGHERKHGWEQINDLPGINSIDDVGQIVRAPNAIEQDGRYDLIIGDNPGGDGQIILRVLGGMIISASAYDTVEDPLGREVYIDEDEEHAIRDGKEITYEELVDAIENADEIWEGSVLDFYVKRMDDGTWRIIKVYTAGGIIYEVSTVIYAETRSEVDEYLEHDINEILRRIY